MLSLEERYSEPAYWAGRMQLDLFRELRDDLVARGMLAADFAKNGSLSERAVQEALDGDFCGGLDDLCELSLAMGKVPVITYRPLAEVIAEAKGVKSEQ